MFTYTAFGHDFISVNNNLFMRGSEIGALHRTDANASLLKRKLDPRGYPSQFINASIRVVSSQFINASLRVVYSQ